MASTQQFWLMGRFVVCFMNDIGKFMDSMGNFA